MTRLALDIGGANLKVADGRGFARSRAFALWQSPERLSDALRALLADSPACDSIVATMTGELCDCFATKAEGVRAIVRSLVAAAGRREVWIYGIDGSFVSPRHALASPLLCAASNWHALASWAARTMVPHGGGLLIDIGSTTSDLIPLSDGRPVAQGCSDPARLASGELVYTGVERSPVCAIVRELPWRGVGCGVAQEWFATTRDVYLTLGELPEAADDRGTADGRPATVADAHDRLARAICADREMFDSDDARRAAAEVHRAQLDLLAASLERVVAAMSVPPQTVIVSGQGEFLARALAARVLPHATLVSMTESLGSDASRAAAAHALAVLAESAELASPSPAPPASSVRVIKLGGSLLDLPDLAERLRRWQAAQPPADERWLVGGGALVDALRAADRVHRLDARLVHRLCIEAMAINAQWVSDLSRDGSDSWQFVDPRGWLAAEDPATALPASWEVTSDSIAARIAAECGASELVLLKSTLPTSADCESATADGYVDAYFARTAGDERNAELRVRCVDLRADGFPEAELLRFIPEPLRL